MVSSGPRLKWPLGEAVSLSLDSKRFFQIFQVKKSKLKFAKLSTSGVLERGPKTGAFDREVLNKNLKQKNFKQEL